MRRSSAYRDPLTRLAVLDIETLSPDQPDGGFPPWPTHLPVVASILIAERRLYGEWHFQIESVPFDEDEAAAIDRIETLLDDCTLVTFNGRGFDLPVLALAAMRARQFKAGQIARSWSDHRFDGRSIDVADLAGNFGSARGGKLADVCAAIGVPCKRQGEGGNVAEMLQNEGIEAVSRYCEEDVSATLMVFAMMQGLRSGDEAWAATLICDFANWVTDAGHSHLATFAELGHNSELARLRLQHRVGVAVEALEEEMIIVRQAAIPFL